MTIKGKYIYGIIEGTQFSRFSLPGVGDADVDTISQAGIAAVVSDTEFSEIDPTRKNVRAHTVVQEELLKEHNLLPMGFGMVAADEGEVRRLLENNYDGLLAELFRLAGRIEVELKVFWEQAAVVNELQGENAELSRLKARINTASSPVEAQNLLSAAGRLVERIAIDWETRYAMLVYDILSGLSCEGKVNNPTGIKNLLNASFLIEKSRESEFREQVYKLDARFQGKMNFKYVGPLPAYNFVNLKLELVKC